MKAQNIQHNHIDTIIQSLSTQGYAICEDFLPVNIISALRKETQQRYINHDMRAAKTGLIHQAEQSAIRGDHIAWLDEDVINRDIQVYFSQMHALKVALNQQLFMNVQSLETHFALYPVGSVYQKHLDQFSHGNNAKSRQLSSILYLNNDWQTDDGGELRLYLDENKYLDILPTAGRLVLFLSAEFWHEVRPAKRERASLTGWFRIRDSLNF
ncbi:MAG: 2OG-Fe(II) oxygenase [Pseudomonadota bacterium]